MKPQIALCTLYEGDYHYGLAALANSLFHSGFSGTLWAGTQGGRPPWYNGGASNETKLSNGMTIRFVDIETPYHFSHYKPWWMQDVLTVHAPESTYVAYFDPDIVVKAPWDFFHGWIERGIAVVGDYYEQIAESHLFRLHWREHAQKRGHETVRKLDRYFNGGFVGARRDQTDFLKVWADLLSGLPDLGLPIDQLLPASKLHPFQMTDQDMLNAALECGDWQLATLPPSAMDLRGEVGQVMCHMTPGAKPWRCGYFMGQRRWRQRAHASRIYWQNVAGPIVPYGKRELIARRLDQRFATLFGRLYAIPWWKS